MINVYTANAKIFLTLLKSTKGKPSVGWHCIKLALLNLIGGLHEEGTDKDIILQSNSLLNENIGENTKYQCGLVGQVFCFPPPCCKILGTVPFPLIYSSSLCVRACV